MTVVHQKSNQLLLIDCQISLQDKIASLERELALRERLYPKWVLEGRMIESEAAREIAVLKAILADYQDAKYREDYDAEGLPRCR